VLTEELDRRTADLLKALDPEASADPDRIESIFQDIAEIERQRRDAAGERFMEFVRLLSPEQRERLMRAMRDNRDRRERRPEGPPRWVVEKFDADRDGHLDDDERRAIKEFFDAQRAARRDRIRERLRALELEHFDADGDGVLGADERAAMLDRFDHDGNGELDPRERWEMGRRLDPALDRDDDRGRGRSPEGRRGPRPDRDHR